MVTAAYRAEEGRSIVEHLDLLALAWSEEREREVSRNEVVQALLEASLKEHPISPTEARRLKSGKKPAKRKRAAPPRIRLIKSTDGKIVVRESGDGGSFSAPQPIPLAA